MDGRSLKVAHSLIACLTYQRVDNNLAIIQGLLGHICSHICAPSVNIERALSTLHAKELQDTTPLKGGTRFVFIQVAGDSNLQTDVISKEST